MKHKFIVAIKETVVEEFEVFAEDAGDALEVAEEKYWSTEFVLEPGDVISRQIAISKPDNEVSEWEEF